MLQALFDKLSDYYYLLKFLQRNEQYIPKEQFVKEVEDVSSRLFPVFVQNELFEGKEYIYVLRLEDNKFYVGWSEHLMERLKDHFFNNNGSQWTKKYKPLEVMKVYRGNKHNENLETLEMMLKHGIENVRGGKWCMTTKEYSFNIQETLDNYPGRGSIL